MASAQPTELKTMTSSKSLELSTEVGGPYQWLRGVNSGEVSNADSVCVHLVSHELIFFYL